MSLQQIEVTEPIVNTRRIKDSRLVIRDATWQSKGPSAVVFSDGDTKTILNNVEIVTDAQVYDPAWDMDKPEVGFHKNLDAIRFQFPEGSVGTMGLNGVKVRNFPRKAVAGFGGELNVDGLSVARCFVGISTEPMGSTKCSISNVHVWDTWGLPGRDEPSIKYPGQAIGGDGIALSQPVSSHIKDCRFEGEIYLGIKVVSAIDTVIERVVSDGIMIQGEKAGGTGRCDGVLVRDCRFNSDIGTWDDMKNGAQLSINCHNLVFVGCLWDKTGRDGSGLQLYDDVHASLYGCIVRGVHGMRGNSAAVPIQLWPADAANGLLVCSINDSLYEINDIQMQDPT